MELAKTIRTRLVTSVTKKRDKLLKEKEQLDIADSSALFLNPNQFTMNIPGSPGGITNPRKTRHMRHRVGDQDEASLDRGRKRKAPADDDGTDSPAPSFRPLPNDTNGAASPYRDARDKTLFTQYEAPVFSIDKLFTDKELAHATTIASIATHHFFHQQATPPSGDSATNSHLHANPNTSTSVLSLDGSTDIHNSHDSADAQLNGTPPPSQLQAPEMERAISHHATRNATRSNPLAALSEAAALTSTNTFVPTLIPITRTDKGAPTPPGVDMVQADSDVALMFREDDIPATATSNGIHHGANDEGMEIDSKHLPESSLRNLRDRFLEQAVRDAMGNAPFRLPLVETGPAHINFLNGVARLPGYGYADPASLRFHMPNGGVPSTANPAGAPALPLVNENLAAVLAGGESMSRTTSFAGSDAGATNGNGNGNGNNTANADGAGAAMRRVRNRLI